MQEIAKLFILAQVCEETLAGLKSTLLEAGNSRLFGVVAGRRS
jgi:hypothetical protein